MTTFIKSKCDYFLLPKHSRIILPEAIAAQAWNHTILYSTVTLPDTRWSHQINQIKIFYFQIRSPPTFWDIAKIKCQIISIPRKYRCSVRSYSYKCIFIYRIKYNYSLYRDEYYYYDEVCICHLPRNLYSRTSHLCRHCHPLMPGKTDK